MANKDPYSKQACIVFWTEDRTRTLQQIAIALFRPKKNADANKGPFPLSVITAQLWKLGVGGEANTWSNALNELRKGPPWPTAQRRSHLLAAFARLRDTTEDADIALTEAGLLPAFNTLVDAHGQSFPQEAHAVSVPRPAAAKTTGLLDIFDRTLGIPDPRLNTWLFGSEQPSMPVVLSTYRRASIADMVARSVTIFHPPRPGESFVRFSHLSLLANVQGSAAKIISLDRPDSDESHPYFTGLVHTYSKKQVLAARIFMIRRLAAPIGDDDFLLEFPGLVGWAKARKSFAEEIQALEQAGEMKKKVLFPERLGQYLDNDLGNIPILMPLSDHLTVPSMASSALASGAAE